MPPKAARGSTRGAARGAARGGGATRGAPAKRGAVKGGATRGGKVAPKSKSQAKEPAKPKWSKEQQAAASLIQKRYREYAERKKEAELRRKHAEYEALMEKAERDAWLSIVRREQEKSDREHEAWLKEERARKAKIKRVKTMLESAFDGEIGEMEEVAKEAEAAWYQESGPNGLHPARLVSLKLELYECTDANEYTPLSEAGAGGATECIEWLMTKGANPNSIGRYGRTPLYRAAFSGHTEAVQKLLENGSDPRIRADDGCTPAEIGTDPTIKVILSEWDIADTERLLVNLSQEKDKRCKVEAEYMKLKCDELHEQIDKAEEVFKIGERQLVKAYQELNKRISEHDLCVLEDKMVEVTLQAVHDAEALVSELKEPLEKSREELQMLKLKLREQQKKEAADDAPIGVIISVKELDDVLIRDVGNKVAEDGRWPLLVDESGQAGIFLRYSDTNYLNVLNPKHMEPETIRMALLGAIRFGKALVVDLMGVDMFHVFEMRCDEIEKGLCSTVMDKSIVKDDKFLSIVKKEDGPDYDREKFWSRMDYFKFWVITSNEPNSELLTNFYVIRVKPAPPKGEFL